MGTEVAATDAVIDTGADTWWIGWSLLDFAKMLFAVGCVSGWQVVSLAWHLDCTAGCRMVALAV